MKQMWLSDELRRGAMWFAWNYGAAYQELPESFGLPTLSTALHL